MSSPSTVVHSDAPLGGVGEAGASAAMLLQGADGVETMEDWQHQEATSQSLPSAGIEPGTDPILLLDQTLQLLVALLAILSRERQNLVLQRRELQGEWRKFQTAKAAAPGVLPRRTGFDLATFQRMNSMLANVNARVIQSVQESYCSPFTRKRQSVDMDYPILPLGWSKRARTEASRTEKPVGPNHDATAQLGYFTLRNGQALTDCVQWAPDNDKADVEVQLLNGFPDDEIVEVQLDTPSRQKSPDEQSKCSWAAQGQSWITRWTEGGKSRTKSFSSRKYGYEKAMALAEDLRKTVVGEPSNSSRDIKSESSSPVQSEESVPLLPPGDRQGNSKGARKNRVEPSKAMIESAKDEGVYYNKSSRTWYIRRPDSDGRVRTKGFSTLRLGLHPAYDAAVKYRKELNEATERVKYGATEVTTTPVSSPEAGREGRSTRASSRSADVPVVPLLVEDF